MNQYEVPALLADELPAIGAELKMVKSFGNVLGSVRIFTEYTNKMVAIHQLEMVKHCMCLAEQLYVKGNNLTRNAIENVFVYAISSMRCCCSKGEWQHIQSQMPVTLHSLYVQQVLKSGL
ncbi:hypothetical protein DXN05_15530 [Deminuibacter soli]|uniref:DUF7674 domain-containing protein n=2 Tax=Deminuibacter soli TaxID=2291815 RepID=A0A3E1NHK5_9BACT|nr:hypothetical protein DXN05_15530 [Deminuibacter soli]